MEWVAEAFSELGHEVARVHCAGALHAASVECDLVVFEQRCAGLNYADVAEIAPGRHAAWAQWTFDLMATEPGRPLAEQPNLGHRTTSGNLEPTGTLRMMRLMDVTLVKERSLLGEYAELGVNARWLDQGCPSRIGRCRHAERPEFDVCLFANFGSAAKQRRGDVKDLLRCRRSIVWAGHLGGDPPPGVRTIPFVPPMDLPAAASRAAVTLCVDQRNDVPAYMSDRTWLALGMGSCVLRRWSPGLPSKMCEVCRLYRTKGEMERLLAELSADREYRRYLGERSRAWVMSNHTYEHRARQVLKEVEKCGRRTSGSAAVATAGA